MNNTEIAEFLKQQRIQQKLTQRQLAKELNVTHQAVSRWENGNSMPDINTLRQIANLYGISIDEILKAEKNHVEIIAEEKQVETINKPKYLKILKYVGIYSGLSLLLLCMSFFILVFQPYAMNIILIVIGLFISSVMMFTMKYKHFFIEYLLITGVLLIGTLILVLPNRNYYMIESEQRMQMTSFKEMLYPNNIEFDTNVQTYSYVFDLYALIYTQNEANIDVFNLTEYQSEDYTTISTNGMIVKDLLVFDEHIYFTTFIEDIPGEFKLYELDFETREFTLLFESNEIFSLFESHHRVLLISDVNYSFDGSKVYQLLDDQTVEFDLDLDYQVSDIKEYYIEYQSKLLVAMHMRNDQGALEFKVAIADPYTFVIEQYVLENLDNVFSFDGNNQSVFGFSRYSGHDIYKFEGNEANLVLNHEAASYFQWLNENLFLVDYMIYNQDFILLQDFVFYKDNYEKDNAQIIINDGSDNYYVIDNEFMGFVIEYPDEPNTWNFNISDRLIMFVPSVLLIGLFISWGQKRKK